MKNNLIIRHSEDDKVGFQININKEIELILPKFFDQVCKDNECKSKEHIYFYRLFKKYLYRKNYQQNSVKRDEKGFSIYKSSEKSKIKNYSLIELYFSLLYDYEENDILVFKEKHKNMSGNGNADWKTTLIRNNPIINDDNIVYDGVYYNNYRTNERHPITQLYLFTISEIYKKLHDNTIIPYYSYDFHKFKDIEYSLYMINKYRYNFFKDREVKVLDILESIYSMEAKLSNFTNNKKKLIYVNKFDYIWEHMCKFSLKSQDKICNKLFKNGKYVLCEKNEKGEEIIRRGHRPKGDVFIETEYEGENYLLILDAKNYSVYHDDYAHFPGTADIGKQFLYKYFLSKKYDEKNDYCLSQIVNAFIFPGILEEESTIKYFAHHRFGNEFDYEKDILCFCIDFYKMRDSYLNYKEEFRSDVIGYILKQFISKRKR